MVILLDGYFISFILVKLWPFKQGRPEKVLVCLLKLFLRFSLWLTLRVHIGDFIYYLLGFIIKGSKINLKEKIIDKFQTSRVLFIIRSRALMVSTTASSMAIFFLIF